MLKIALARRFGLLGVSLAALALSQGVRAEDGPDHAAKNAADHIKTASPIKHVIILIGENRGTDHTFGVYKPRGKHQTISNLLSKGIVNEDGTIRDDGHAPRQSSGLTDRQIDDVVVTPAVAYEEALVVARGAHRDLPVRPHALRPRRSAGSHPGGRVQHRSLHQRDRRQDAGASRHAVRCGGG